MFNMFKSKLLIFFKKSFYKIKEYYYYMMVIYISIHIYFLKIRININKNIQKIYKIWSDFNMNNSHARKSIIIRKNRRIKRYK